MQAPKSLVFSAFLIGNIHTVTVTHEVVKAKSKYKRREISDPYQSRTLPLICLIRDCWELIRKKQKIGYHAKTQHPLVPLKINKDRRATPDILVDEISKYVKSIDGILLRKVTSREDISIPGICELLKKTAYQKMHDVHLEDEEIRAVLGKSPKRVSGKHYYDRHNEGAINKIGSLIDKWTKSVEMKHFLNGNYLLGTKRRRELIIAAGDAAKCMQVSIVVELDGLPVHQIPDDGVELEICAFGGMRGAVDNESMKEVESNG